MSTGSKVLIVGGGLAGLGAAYELRKRGLNHTVLEASPRVGGRVMTEEVKGFRIDAGANIFLEAYGTVRAVAEDLGVSMQRTPVPIIGGTYHNDRLHGFYGGHSLKSLFKSAKTFLSFRLLSPKGVLQVFKFAGMLKSRAENFSFDDHSPLLDLETGKSTAEFVEANLGAEFLERFVQPILSGYTLGYPEEVGTPHAMASFWHFGLNGVAWPRMPEQGVGVLAEALARVSQENIRLSTPVERIVLEDGRAKGVLTRGGDFVEADAVISATTASTAIRLAPGLPADMIEALERVTYSKCCRVVFGLDSSPFPPDWYGVAFPRQMGGLISGMSNSAVLLPRSVPEGKALVHAFVIGDKAEKLFALSDAEIANQVIEEAREYFPAIPRQPLFSRVYRWKEAVCLAPSGMMQALSQLRRRSLNHMQGLFFAGEYMGGVPSTSGALRSGMVAAEDCTRFLGTLSP